ncbi:hypothetical protein [Comamonas testosteroni]|jgi:hypothetical protein|uniref:hypothetical protein n=1 Tax=Comamonas testosteroni TaxID=285 RepID=UPI0026EE6347|nr:hypothetical protein [Comamonas testosteroni]
MPAQYVFTPNEISEAFVPDAIEVNDIQVIRRLAPQIACWTDSQIADSWQEYSQDLRGLSWSSPSSSDSKQFLAYMMVKKLFPHVDAWACGYEKYEQLGQDEPWVKWPQFNWPSWTH